MNDRIFMFLLVVVLQLNGCKQEKRYHAPVQNLSDSEVISQIIEFQEQQNALFKDPETSPLRKKDKKVFTGLEFFAPDTNYIVKARYNRTPDAQPFLMATTTDREMHQRVHGLARFELNGVQHELEVFESLEPLREATPLFLPFLDNTNGTETYGGGRYINLEMPAGDTLVIDFNRAYNPYCVYNKKYSCPIVPRQNQMRTMVRAGVKDFKK